MDIHCGPQSAADARQCVESRSYLSNNHSAQREGPNFAEVHNFRLATLRTRHYCIIEEALSPEDGATRCRPDRPQSCLPSVQGRHQASYIVDERNLGVLALGGRLELLRQVLFSAEYALR